MALQSDLSLSVSGSIDSMGSAGYTGSIGSMGSMDPLTVWLYGYGYLWHTIFH